MFLLFYYFINNKIMYAMLLCDMIIYAIYIFVYDYMYVIHKHNDVGNFLS